jgi:hypothetical protein
VTEDIETSTHQRVADDPPAVAGDEPAAGGASASGSDARASSLQARASSLQERVVTIADERPEAAIGAAFGGGLLLALILRRIAR